MKKKEEKKREGGEKALREVFFISNLISFQN